MQLKLFILLFCTSFGLLSQEAVHNYGNIQIHGSVAVGFHMDLMNDGTFDQNLGLVGFYGEDKTITISGAFSPIFHDTEIAVDNGLILETAVGVNNNSSFISGNILTPRDQSDICLNIMNDAFYIGESDLTKIHGYGAIYNKDIFTFPVGIDDRLRPLTIESSSVNTLAKCAYFYEDPNAPTVFGTRFDTDVRATDVLGVSTMEFWRLEGDIPSKVTLTWDGWSNVNILGEFLSDLKVVGWSKIQNQWVNLGNTAVDGGLAYGSVTSDDFIPNDYEIITIGGTNDLLEAYNIIELDNYFMTPNGDGSNDLLVIDGIQNSTNNNLQIFNRYGVLVYSKANYNNEFDGFSNRNSVISQETGLETGIYFYVITMNDLRQQHQGYFYLTR